MSGSDKLTRKGSQSGTIAIVVLLVLGSYVIFGFPGGAGGEQPVVSATEDDHDYEEEVMWIGEKHQGSNVYRDVDEEAGVVCYASDGGFAGGISCLPLNETKLGGNHS